MRGPAPANKRGPLLHSWLPHSWLPWLGAVAVTLCLGGPAHSQGEARAPVAADSITIAIREIEQVLRSAKAAAHAGEPAAEADFERSYWKATHARQRIAKATSAPDVDS
jgi:hypothetical protein